MLLYFINRSGLLPNLSWREMERNGKGRAIRRFSLQQF